MRNFLGTCLTIALFGCQGNDARQLPGDKDGKDSSPVGDTDLADNDDPHEPAIRDDVTFMVLAPGDSDTDGDDTDIVDTEVVDTDIVDTEVVDTDLGPDSCRR